MPDMTGQELMGRYKVLEFLGRGGMADVYRVFDNQRSVELALKLLHPDLAQDVVFLRHFRREAQTLGRLQHPNIVRFFGFEQDDVRSFMLLEFVDGSTLRNEIFRAQGKGLPIERILEILRPVCAALNYAHQQGFIHCDIKPANIMIHKNGNVLLADFGIARMTENATGTMLGAGTPTHMAPEQVLGEEPSMRTDIYALGVVLYEMLTGGERPFTGEQARITGSTSDKIRWEKLNRAATPLRTYLPSISTRLEAVVLRCLEKDPAKRYAGPLELIQALSAAVAKRSRIPFFAKTRDFAIQSKQARAHALRELILIGGAVGLVATVIMGIIISSFRPASVPIIPTANLIAGAAARTEAPIPSSTPTLSPSAIPLPSPTQTTGVSTLSTQLITVTPQSLTTATLIAPMITATRACEDFSGTWNGSLIYEFKNPNYPAAYKYTSQKLRFELIQSNCKVTGNIIIDDNALKPTKFDGNASANSLLTVDCQFTLTGNDLYCYYAVPSFGGVGSTSYFLKKASDH